MKTTFYIVLNVKTGNGYESIGKFCIGNNSEFAGKLFLKLLGSPSICEKSVLSLELTETRDGLPFNVQMIGCTLDELAENTKIIARETFKLFNMETS
jgi:hypothetical protein